MFRQGIDDKPTGSPPMIGKRLDIADWLAYCEAYRFTGVSPDRVVLHHTISPNAVTWRGLRSMTAMQTYYRTVKHWTSAPHIYAGPDGIWLFTPLDRIGIHAGIGNAGYWHGKLLWYSVGLEMVGFFDRDKPQGSVWENSLAVLGGLCKKFNKPAEQVISFHRDYTNEKSCPGWAVTKPWVFEQVNLWLAANKGLLPSQQWVTVEADALRIRQGPKQSYKIVRLLHKDEHVLVDGTKDEGEGEWWHAANGEGFFAKKYTRLG